MSKKDEALKLALVAERVLKAWDDPQGMPALCEEMNCLREVLAEPAQHLVGSARCPRCWEPITPPASKPWVGLTYGEVLEQKKDDPIQFYRAIEAKLKEKNT